jgi:transketolase
MRLEFGSRRATYVDVSTAGESAALTPAEAGCFDELDRIYRSLCAILFNYAPGSGHPGGSISSGRFVSGLLFDSLDYDFSQPDREDADVISYAAGHKAMGLYAFWALRDEIMRIAAPEMLPSELRYRLRLEDLLGFRHNPTTKTPLFTRFGSRALDGHPTPATPFVRLSTGASGVGVASSIGLALGAKDYYGKDAPRVHLVEGEGGLTPGRVAEALAAAGTASLDNVLLHLDWNQASIDSNQVCRENGHPGDYVQWTPMELFYLHDWNVIFVPDGRNMQQILGAQRVAARIDNGQPTAVIYRTVKGWGYGIEGRASHGAGHRLCSEGFHQAVADLTREENASLPSCEPGKERCKMQADGSAILEECFWEALGIVRRVLETDRPTVEALARRIRDSKERLDRRSRRPRAGAPSVESVYAGAASSEFDTPPELQLKPGVTTTLRAELGRALHYYNRTSGGSILAASADLLGSTNVNTVAAGFPQGFWNAASNIDARLLSTGGICEDAMTGILSGISTFGHHIGIGSSYGSFLAPLGHIAARLHAIGGQARRAIADDPYRPIILICAHAGLKTGEDGPTHADPQPLQLMQENFPRGTCVTLTPWDPTEIWPLLAAALVKRPAVLVPYVTRPNEKVLDRAALGLAPAEDAVKGVYLLRHPRGKGDGTIVLQESAVTYAFLEDTLPLLEAEGIDPWVYYVSSAELFDLLPVKEQKRIFPKRRAQEAIGITGFTLPTLYRWVTSDRGRAASLHPFRHGNFLGSGQGHMVLAEAGLDGQGQFAALKKYFQGTAG